jgi:sodium/proline symporter
MVSYIFFAIVYCIFVIAVGSYYGRSSSSHLSDYYLAERGAKRWIGAFAASASSESAWVLMGLVGAAYTSGLSVLWLIPGCVLGYAFN